MHGLYHCARCLVVLTCLWSRYSIIFSMWMSYRLTYIGYFPFKWKQICARQTSGGGEGSLVCCGGSGVLLEARWRGLPVERIDIGVYVHCVPQQRRQIRSAGLLSRIFLFASLFWFLLEHEVYKKYSSVGDLVRPMMMKRSRRWHWLVFCQCLSFLHMFSILTINACVQLGLLIVKCLLDYTYLSRQTNMPIASAFKTVVIVVLLIFVRLLSSELVY